MSGDVYHKLCNLSKKNFEEFILEKLEDNWGRSKGGTNSPKNLKQFKKPIFGKELAETFGIILGDGHVSEYIRNKKIRVYCVRIAGNSKTDKDYIFNYIPRLFENVFGEKGSIIEPKFKSVGYFTIYGKSLVEFLKSNGLSSGNKIMNNVGIPTWIKKNKDFLKFCIRGLIDTDGSIHKISKDNPNLRIEFTSHIPKLLLDVRLGFVKLGYNPSKIINNKHFFLSRQEEIKKYVNEIGFGNAKNLNRYKIFNKRPRH